MSDGSPYEENYRIPHLLRGTAMEVVKQGLKSLTSKGKHKTDDTQPMEDLLSLSRGPTKYSTHSNGYI
ncbi:hypothetical protein H5410_030535, partial [Solanum commersonii]